MAIRMGSKFRKATILLSLTGGAALCVAGLPVTTGIGIGLILCGVVLLWVDSIVGGSDGSDDSGGESGELLQ